MEKEKYFQLLYALNGSSDSEEDTNDTREFLKRIHRPRLSSLPSAQQPSQPRRTQHLDSASTTPVMQRTTSAPVSSTSVVKETPPIPKTTSLLRFDVSGSETIQAQTSSGETPATQNVSTCNAGPHRSLSTSNIGSVIMNNSKGIAAMLGGKKRKRKEKVIKLAPEGKRIFRDKTFYFIPPDDVAPLRRFRIEKAISLGATWTRTWIPSITHIIADKELTYPDVMKFLRPIIDSDFLPSHILLVNHSYTSDCARYGFVVDPKQPQYVILRHDLIAREEPLVLKPTRTSEITPASPRIKKAKPQKGLRESTPPRTQSPQPTKTPNTSADPYISSEQDEVSRIVETPVGPKVYLKRGDVLDEMIESALQLEHLPLDDDDEEDSGPSCHDGPEISGDSSGEEERRVSKRQRSNKHAKKGAFNQAGFTCMTGGTGVMSDLNPNKETISILQEMCEHYDRAQDHWRTMAYRKAIGALKKQTTKINFYEDAIKLTSIGHRLAAKIEEIALTHRLRRLENAKMEPNDQVLQLFLKIYGVGPRQAHQWIQAGHRTLSDLKALAHLSQNQKLGIEHYDDFCTRISRDEVTALGKIVKDAVARVDSEVEVIIGGSYRRRAETCGDIDFILTKRHTTSSLDLLPFLRSLIDYLTEQKFLVAALAVPKHSGSKWHGACVLPGFSIWRRVDFLIVPDTEIGAALLYFTGDDIFNRSMRLLAGTKGMRLNQRGLYKDVMRGHGRLKVTEGSLLEGADERRIFEILGVPWREPWDRICH